MFTGIVEELGKVRSVYKDGTSFKISILCNTVLENLKLGDSISVNGICLTVSHFDTTSFTADAMPETLHKTNLAQLSNFSLVNLERAMAVGTRFGGHIVTGHIDGIGSITDISRDANAIWLTISCSDKILYYIVNKGSVSVDGTSLTVAAVDDLSFKVSLIPHTAKHSVLGYKNPSETVNIECDIVGKYIEKFINAKQPTCSSGSISMDFLVENGFA